METIEQIIKAHYADKGEAVMWESTKIISDAVEASMPEEAKESLKKDIYELMCGWHFNEAFAKQAVSKMYYTDERGEKMYAPYWTEQAVREIYEGVKDKIPAYNFWDFFVTMHSIASDNHALLIEWFPDEDMADREKRYVKMTVNWLADEDNPYGPGKKAWGYFNGK